MGKRRRVDMNGQSPARATAPDAIDAKIAKLEAATARLEAAMQQAREVTAELHASIQASKDAGARMIADVREEFDRQGVPRLVLHRVDAYLEAEGAKFQAFYDEWRTAFRATVKTIQQQTALIDKGLKIIEQWVARLFLLSKSKKFREVARQALGKDVEPSGDLNAFLGPLQEESRAYLAEGTQPVYEMEDAMTGAKVTLHVHPPTSNGK